MMSKAFVPIVGPVVADTAYVNNRLVARDVAVTLPEVAPSTVDVQAMGTMSLPVWQMLENMELAITKIGVDMGLSKMVKPGSIPIEIRWAQTVTDANGNTKNVGCKAFLRCLCSKLPSAELEVGSASEAELTYTVTRYQLVIDGEEAWLVDRLAGICRIGGTDYAADLQNML